MTDRLINSISGRLSLRSPQRRSLEILARILEIATPSKKTDVSAALTTIKSEFASVIDFERDFPSLCFALATGVGKTRLMGAFISYLHLLRGINHFFVLAPNLTIYNKLIMDFTPNTPKYVFKGISEFSIEPPLVITGDNYESGIGVREGFLFETGIHINIFNISKINEKKSKEGATKSNTPKFRRLNEFIGESYFEYLQGLPDLVLLMDESHRYRASAGMAAINELKPILGLELTATPFIERGTQTVPFKNVIYDFPLAQAMESGFVKEPAVVTQKNFNASQFTPAQLEKIKLEDGIRIHENTKVELETYARESDQPIVKPFILVVARDTTHADELQKLIESDQFFDGRYKGKAIQVHSNQSGEEKEEFVQRLLAVEKSDEPTEIVIHVNMLKEGWDVTNLYTIVPLRAANARTLVEQSIGRGLRLPYGKRTGVNSVDRLNIIAHDRFQEIVDEANRADSPIRLKTLIIDPDADFQKTKTVICNSIINEKILSMISETDAKLKTGTPKTNVEPLFNNDQERLAAKAVLEVIKQQEHLPSSKHLLKPEIQEKIRKNAEVTYLLTQQELPGLSEKIDMTSIVTIVSKAIIEGTIDIPRILVIPKNQVAFGFKSFKLVLTSLNFQPVAHDLLIQHLRTYKQETLGNYENENEEIKLENYIVRALVDYEDISYDEQSDLLYELAGQVVTHFRSYLKDDEEVRNVLLYHQKQIASFIHVQMLANQLEDKVEYEVKISKGFTELKPAVFTAIETEGAIDFRKNDYDKKKINQLIFLGFSKCLYLYTRFNSDTERRFATILERECIKWLRPAKGQFQLYYKLGNEQPEYVPDFVAECTDVIYMIETKAKNEMTSDEIIQKKAAAEKWCYYASEHNKNNGGKPWKYLLIPHDEVKDNMTLKYYEQRG